MASTDTPLQEISETAAFITNKLRRVSTISTDSASTTKAPSVPDGPPKPISMVRRRSSLKGIATTLFAMRRMSRLSVKVPEEPAKPKVKMENTYKMAPDSGFDMKLVENTIRKNMNLYLKDEKYSATTSPSLTCDLCTSIKNAVKALNIARYKFVCQVIIGQCMDQGVHAASRNVWNPSTDNYTCISYQNDSLFALAIVCATYYE